jgi:UDP-glucose 4-epimerase
MDLSIVGSQGMVWVTGWGAGQIVRLVVFGGTGFIGTHVVDLARSHGHRVVVVARRSEMLRPPRSDVEYLRMDLGKPEDTAALPEILRDADAVLHLASSTVPGTGDKDPTADVRDNLVGLVAVLLAMTAVGTRRLIYLSSGGAVYGPPESIPIREDHRLLPVSSYGIVKVAAEHYIRLFSRNQGLSSVVLRPSNPYGERQSGIGVQGLVSTLLSRAMSLDPVEVWGDGSAVRDYLHVQDLAALILQSTESDVEGTYNAGSGQGISVNGMIALVNSITGRRLSVTYQAARSVDASKSILDCSAARAAFGWEPHIALEDGIRATWNWVRSRPQVEALPSSP